MDSWGHQTGNHYLHLQILLSINLAPHKHFLCNPAKYWQINTKCWEYMTILNQLTQVSMKITSHRVALCPTHHLSVVEPLWSKHLVESPQRELPLLEDARESAGCKAPQAPLEPQLMLLLRPELSPPKGTYHRVPTAPPLLGMTWWTRNTTPLVWCLTPAQLRKERGKRSNIKIFCGKSMIFQNVSESIDDHVLCATVKKLPYNSVHSWYELI